MESRRVRVSAPPVEREASGSPLEGGKSALEPKFETRSTKSETNSNRST